MPFHIVALALRGEGLEAVHMVLVAVGAFRCGMSVSMHVGGQNVGIAGHRLSDCLLDILESLFGLIKQEGHDGDACPW